MNNLFTPIVLIVLSAALFFSFTDKQYSTVKTLKAENAEYESAIEQSKNLLQARDRLLAQYNSFPTEDLRRLEKLIPDTIDNVRLIIDINGVTARYGTTIKNLKVNTITATNEQDESVPDDGKAYHSATLSFSVSTTYDKFIQILKDLEKSLRILDISTVTFESKDKEPYDFDVTVRTYWMK